MVGREAGRKGLRRRSDRYWGGEEGIEKETR